MAFQRSRIVIGFFEVFKYNKFPFYYFCLNINILCTVTDENAPVGNCNSSNDSMSASNNKKSRVIGNVDIDSPEVQRLLKAKSSHAGLLTEVLASTYDLTTLILM